MNVTEAGKGLEDVALLAIGGQPATVECPERTNCWQRTMLVTDGGKKNGRLLERRKGDEQKVRILV